ncbi:MAG: C40 family peptidase [Thermoguttaceae bacterium]|nr:C40 family peptidase [Thermoguttaceae bacterium]
MKHATLFSTSLALTAFFLVSAFARADESAQALASRLDAIESKYAPDLRLNLFETTVDAKKQTARVATTSKEACDAIRRVAADFPGWKIDAALYPEENLELNGKWRALVNFSSIQLQKKPDHASEWGTQSVMGTPVRILKKEGGWVLIQNDDGYLGYATSGSVAAKTEEEFEAWLRAKKVVWLENYGFIYAEPRLDAPTISDLTPICALVWKDETVENGFYRVETPDGRLGWIPQKGAMEYDEWLNSRELTADALIATARRFLGSPYVWGGATSKGMDCSGLVSLTFRINGFNILRDVSQIRREGIDVDVSQGYKNFQPGDLLIFGQKRSNGTYSWRHVAIYEGDGRFVHSATSVHESSLDPDSPIYDAYNARELIKVVRMIGAPYTEHFHPLQGRSSSTQN